MEGTEPTVDLSIQNISDSEFPVKRRKDSKKRLFTAVVFATVVGFVIGILIGRFAISPREQTAASKDDMQTSVDHAQAGVYHSLTQEENEEIGQLIIDGISSKNIRENLRYVLLHNRYFTYVCPVKRESPEFLEHLNLVNIHMQFRSYIM